MAIKGKPRTTKGMAVHCAKAAQEKMARDILIMDISGIDASPAEFFVIVTVDSEPQLRAVCASIIAEAKAIGLGPARLDGKGSSSWTIIDYFNVVVHVMHDTARSFYKLERLWGDGKMYALTPSGTARAISSYTPPKNDV